MTDSQRILNRLRKEMHLRGLSISALARIAGYHPNTLQLHFNGNQQPKLEAIVDMAKVLGLRLELVSRDQPSEEEIEKEVQRRVAERLHIVRNSINQLLENQE